MRIISVFLLSLVGLSSMEACKPRKTTKSSHAKAAEPASIPNGSGNGLNLSGTGFVWEKAELPLCYSERTGVKFFVWKEQSTFACNKGQKDWQLVAEQNPATKKKKG